MLTDRRPPLAVDGSRLFLLASKRRTAKRSRQRRRARMPLFHQRAAQAARAARILARAFGRPTSAQERTTTALTHRVASRSNEARRWLLRRPQRRRLSSAAVAMPVVTRESQKCGTTTAAAAMAAATAAAAAAAVVGLLDERRKSAQQRGQKSARASICSVALFCCLVLRSRSSHRMMSCLRRPRPFFYIQP